VPNAAGYFFQISTTPTFKTTVFQADISDTSVSVSGLGSFTKYYWEVRDSTPLSVSCFQATPYSFTTVLRPPPAPPVLVSPVENANKDSTNPAFSWHPGYQATSYEIQISVDSFATTIKDTVVADTSYTYSGDSILNCTSYRWRVLARNSAGNTAYSAPRSFTTMFLVPGVPSLVSPPDSATGLPAQPKLKWKGDVCSQTYTIQVASDTGFTALVLNVAVNTPDSIVVSTPFYGISTYYWRVRANSTTGSGLFSAYRTFTTALFIPSVPALVSPGQDDVIVTQQATLIWKTSIDNPATYHLQVDIDSTYPHPLVDTVTADTSYTTPPLPFCSKYFWRVSASNAAGTSAWTTPTRAFFSATVVPAHPILTSPHDTATGVPFVATLHWLPADPCTQKFHVQVSTDSLFSPPAMVADSTLALDSIRIGPLKSKVEYFWRVAAIGIQGASPLDSARRRFTTTELTPPDSVVPVAPPDSATGLPLTVRIAWDSSARATDYHLFVAYDSAFTLRAFEDSTITQLFQLVGPLPNNTKFFWKVRASNKVGIGSYSAVWSFSTLAPPSPPVPVHPVAGDPKVSSNGGFNFYWTIPDRADSTYELQIEK
jgi:hypothetical protein